ncbi:MarR family winged helix-turn-helix transcriptional regulator [Paenibacillus massiliensis]|uniref:MarR family winged helix-turn-helix transcriptional regulator n=1 Tax=Paenibacillus massiliensis TaxID=225917 RepID=UPI00040C23CA|nr:MarR family winged helix-turn-helix transcriptional regulator [Paenibacillus massiliensis]
MENIYPDLNLIDLISEKHLALRRAVGELDGNRLNKTETHILSILERHEPMSISEISRRIHISRQGTHKSIQGLLAQDMIATTDTKANQRDRNVTITQKGRDYNHQLLAFKLELEQQIVLRLGEAKISAIKSILSEEWLD